MSKEAALKARQWRVVDADGVPLGVLASNVAQLIRGKHKPTFTPHVDCGDYVVVTNAGKVSLGGKKADQKLYHRHSGYVGGLKSVSAGELKRENPAQLVELAVKGMLPKGALGHQMIKKLKVCAGSEHPHSAHNPVPYEVKF